MPKGVKPDLKPTSVAEAVRNGDWVEARRAMAARLADAFDMTDSARDLKALSLSLIPLVEACEVDMLRDEDTERSPLFKIVEEARSA